MDRWHSQNKDVCRNLCINLCWRKVAFGSVWRSSYRLRVEQILAFAVRLTKHVNKAMLIRPSEAEGRPALNEWHALCKCVR